MYALVLMDISPRKIEEVQWFQLLEEIEGDVQPNAKTKKIFGSAWLIDISNELNVFYGILTKVQAYKVPYKVSFFENEPKFTT